MSYLSARYIKEVFGSGFTWVVEEIIGNLDNIIREPCLCNAGKSVSALLSFFILVYYIDDTHPIPISSTLRESSISN